MHRLFQYFEHYGFCDPALQAYLMAHGKLRSFQKQEPYTYSDTVSETWCFILEGAVALISYTPRQRPVIHRVYTPNHYFSGTKHPFSKTAEPYSIVFLRSSMVYEMRNPKYQEALEHFPIFQTFVQVIKQHEIDQLRHTLRVIKLPSTERIAYLHDYLPEVDQVTTVEQKRSFLNISNNREYYKALRYALSRR